MLAEIIPNDLLLTEKNFVLTLGNLKWLYNFSRYSVITKLIPKMKAKICYLIITANITHGRQGYYIYLESIFSRRNGREVEELLKIKNHMTRRIIDFDHLFGFLLHVVNINIINIRLLLDFTARERPP